MARHAFLVFPKPGVAGSIPAGAPTLSKRQRFPLQTATFRLPGRSWPRNPRRGRIPIADAPFDCRLLCQPDTYRQCWEAGTFHPWAGGGPRDCQHAWPAVAETGGRDGLCGAGNPLGRALGS